LSDGLRQSIRLSALAVNKADDAGDRARWQMLRDKHVQAIEETGDYNVFSAERFDVGNLSGFLGRHTGALPSLPNARALSKFGLCNSGAIYGNSHSRSLKFVLQR